MIEEQEESSYGDKSPKEWQKYWIKELDGFASRTRKYRKQGDRVVERYVAERTSKFTDEQAGLQQFSLNLFHSNVTTLQSMLYGSTPQVEVTREHYDPDDDQARVAAMLYQRILTADVDPSGEGFPTVIRSALQDRLLPGMGIARVRYEAEFAEQPTGVIDPETGEEAVEEVLVSESAPIDYVHWGDFSWGWGRTWKELDWIAFKNYLTKEQCIARFGEEKCKNLTYKHQSFDEDGKDQNQGDKDEQSVVMKAEIQEIWCKSQRMVFWFQKGLNEPLDIKEDPLGLEGFWPCPKPMTANLTTKMYLPTADFVMAQDLYNQIDNLYTRVTIITRAVKVVGVYDQAAGTSVARMLQEGMENDLIPVDNWAMFAESGGLRGKIDWYPVETVVQTLQTLRSVMQEQISLLNQVTGMADIMRGESKQYAGVGQEQLKAQYGSIRVQALQEDFARFSSELEELRAEVISKHFEPTTILEQSNAEYVPAADKGLVVPAIQLMKTPAVKWRVNIRPESIAMIDYQSLKAERTEYIMAISQYIQSAQAMADKIPQSLPVLLEMMKWGVAGFKGANYLEGILDQAIQMAMQAQQQPQGGDQPNPEMIKAQTEQMKARAQIQKAQLDLQKTQMKAQSDIQLAQTKLQGDIQKIITKANADKDVDAAELATELENLRTEFTYDMQRIQEQLRADIAVETAQAELDMTSDAASHQHRLVEINASRRTN